MWDHITSEELKAVRKRQVGRYGTVDVTKPYSDSIAYAKAVLDHVTPDVNRRVSAAYARGVADERAALVSLARLHGHDEFADLIEFPPT